MEEGGERDLSDEEHVKSGQMWVQLFLEYNCEKGLKGGKEKTLHLFSHLFIQRTFM